jgi:hypothetical protein
MYNLSDEIFMETIIYLQNFGLDYFEVIRNNLDKFDEKLLEVRKSNQFWFFVIHFHSSFNSG